MKQQWTRALIAANVMAISACGGSGGGSSSGRSTAGLEGVVAVGAPVPNAEVVIKDASGITQTATADSKGHYVISDISSLKAPYILQATGTVGGSTVVLHSLLDQFATTDGSMQVVNVTPATSAIAAQALQADPSTAFSNVTTTAPLAVDTTRLTAAKERLRAALADVLTALGQDATKVDLITTKFTADNTGLDKLFDLISVQTSATTSTSRDIVVAEKKPGGTSVTVGSDVEVANVTKLAKPGDEVNLDLGVIKNFVDNFNTYIQSEAGVKSSAMQDFFDSEFLDNGMNRDELIEDLVKNAVSKIKMSGLVINGCTAVSASTASSATSSLTGSLCNTQITITNIADQSTETMPMKFRLGSDGKWRAYGNRAPFDFEIKPVATWSQNVGGDTAVSTSTSTGINFWFTGQVKNVSTYKSAQLYFSTDGGTTWTLLTTLKTAAQGSNCGTNSNWLPIDGGSPGNCTNMLKLDDDSIAAAVNSALAQGQAKFKIKAFTDRDLTTGAMEFTTYATRPLFTVATGKQALADTSTSITMTDMDSNSVQFSAGTALLDSVGIAVRPSNFAGGSLPWSNWNNTLNVKALNGTVTVAKALALCKVEAGTDATANSTCETNYGASSGAVIKRIHLSARDSLGRGIWKSWYVNGY